MAKTALSEYICSLDDFGLSKELDSQIFSLLKPGDIHRVSVIVNLYDISSSMEELLSIDVKKDIHLNISNTHHLSLWGKILLLVNIYFKKNFISDVEKKWSIQIERFHALFDAYPDGINSHEHVHLHPKLFPVALKLAKKYAIPYIRHGNQSVRNIRDYRSLLFNWWHKHTINDLSHSEIQTSTTLYSYDWNRLSEKEVVNTLPRGTEIIFHPQYKEDVEFLESLR